MNALKLCLAGTGQSVSVWLSVYRNELVDCTLDSPKRHEQVSLDDFVPYLLLVPVDPRRGPKTTHLCPYLTAMAGKKAAKALRNHSIHDLALAMISQYGWQIANGAKPLADRGALAKVYGTGIAVYVYASPCERDRSAERLTAKG